MNWYCIHTRPQKEVATRQYYSDSLGVETYHPTLREQRVIRRVRRVVVRPLFPRYLFCRFEPAFHYRAVRYAPDVIDVVHLGAAPTIVPDQLIADLKNWAGDELDVVSLQRKFSPGDLVDIADGPLMGLRAVVQHELSDSQRVAVLLAFLDCGARTVVDRSQLRIVG